MVFAVDLRLRIVTELYMKEMSPKQFFEQFGGGSISRVDAHFKTLQKHGWLRFIRAESGGSRHGATEHFYRATELAVFDLETWSLLPYSVKVAFSWTSFNQLTERVREALLAKTFDSRSERHLTWSPLLVDRLGWERILSALNALFEALCEVQAEAKLRIPDFDETPLLATAAIAAFESPARPGDEQAARDLPKSHEPLIPFTSRLSKVFADEICLRIVAELNLRAMSVPQFHREFSTEMGGISVDSVRTRFRKLIELGWLTKVGVNSGEGRRGPSEHLYRATEPAIFDSKTWAEVPGSIKAHYSWRTFDQLTEQVKQAMEAGTFDARDDRHLTWLLLRLDQQGWETVIAELAAVFACIFEEQASAKQRLSKSGEAPIRMTVALAGFESPKDTERQL